MNQCISIHSKGVIKIINREKVTRDPILPELVACKCPNDNAFYAGYHEYRDKEDFIAYMFRILPGSAYVVNQVVNLIMSNGLTTGDENEDKKLNDWLFSLNKDGETNYNVYRSAIYNAIVYGKCGIRWLGKGGIVIVQSKRYASIRQDDPEFLGTRRTIGYLVATRDEKVYGIDEIELTFDVDEFLRSGEILSDDKRIIFLTKDKLLNMRNNEAYEDGLSPFFTDEFRTNLLRIIYERMIHDLEYDGPGRLYLKMNAEYSASSTANAEGSTLGATGLDDKSNLRYQKIKKEVEDLARAIKESGSDDVIAVSNAFSGDPIHLPRTTKAIEFLSYIENTKDVEIMAQVIGVSSVLINVGESNGNISQEAIIDHAMLNDIIPQREVYATQFSTFIADKIGVTKVYFDKYELKQSISDADTWHKLGQTAVYLRNAELYDALDDLEVIIRNSFRTEGVIKTLANKVNRTIKNLFNRKKRGRKT